MRLTDSIPVRAEIAALVVTLAGMLVQIAFGVHYGTVPPGTSSSSRSRCCWHSRRGSRRIISGAG